jgi:DNA-binding IclR family transcriptional regulator
MGRAPQPSAERKETAGAQSLRRALDVLRLLASHHEKGLRTNDVIEQSGLERSTAHRLLSCLVEEQFAERDPATRRYRLGMESMRLGFASLRRAPVVDTYRPVLQRLARLSEDTVFLVVRQGDYGVCLHREEGSFPVRIFTVDVGIARPLGIGAAGMALLAALPDEEIAGIRDRHSAAFEEAGVSSQALARMVERTRRLGYSETIDLITPGVAGVGAVIPSRGRPFGAVSFGSISSRLDPRRRAQLGPELVAALAAGA